MPPVSRAQPPALPSPAAFAFLVGLIALFLALNTSPGQAAPRGHAHHKHTTHRHHREKPARAPHFGISDRRRVAGPRRCALKGPRRGALAARRAICATPRRKSGAKPAPTPAVDPSSLYWGAWIGEQFTGAQAPWDMNAVAQFEQITEKPLSLVNFSAPFAECSTSPCHYLPFPLEAMENVRRHGAVPFFSWASQSSPSSLEEPQFQLADVIEGKYDSYIREFATAAKNWGHPFFLRFNWEMNGNWFPWSEGVNGNSSGQYVAAWRHVHEIFTSVGATNATWTWCPNVDPENKLQNLAALYPGDEYVDWTCLDGYNWGTSPVRHDKWRTFDELFSSTYHKITDEIAPSKPMVIGEVGSTEEGGSKAQWISEMLTDVPTEYPKIHGLQWFEKEEEGDWPIESSSSSAAAFAAGIKSSSYLANEFASAGSGPIQAPTG
jgi:Glycosyl hydrolase family 26